MWPSILPQTLDIVTIAAGTAEDRYVTPPADDGGEWKLTYATYTPATTDAADASNYTTIALKNGATTLGSLSNASTAFTAGTPRAFTLTGGTSLEFTAGTDSLDVNKAETGTGGILDGAINLLWERVS